MPRARQDSRNADGTRYLRYQILEPLTPHTTHHKPHSNLPAVAGPPSQLPPEPSLSLVKMVPHADEGKSSSPDANLCFGAQTSSCAKLRIARLELYMLIQQCSSALPASSSSSSRSRSISIQLRPRSGPGHHSRHSARGRPTALKASTPSNRSRKGSTSLL